MTNPVDHVLLTVGLSELPVLIAAHRLCVDASRQGHPMPDLHFICTSDRKEQKGSYPEANRAIQLLRAKLVEGGRSVERLRHSIVMLDNRFDAPAIAAKISQHFSEYGGKRLHLDYTGGTGAMNAGCFQALIERKYAKTEKENFSSSFVSIQDSKVLFDPNLTVSPDERKELKLKLRELISLHGWSLQNPRQPEEALIAASILMTDQLASGPELQKAYAKWIEAKFERPVPRFRDDILQALASTETLRGGLVQNGAWTFDAGRSEKACTFFHNQCLELAAMAALRQAQSNLGLSLEIQHSLKAVPPSGDSRNHFELDIATIFGYELLGISCSNTVKLKTVKVKAMEVLHRMRTVGGIGARTIVLSMLPKVESLRAEDSLRDDLGGRELNVKLMRYTSYADLVKEFETYMTDLDWRP